MSKKTLIFKGGKPVYQTNPLKLAIIETIKIKIPKAMAVRDQWLLKQMKQFNVNLTK